MLLGDCVRETDIWTNLDKVNLVSVLYELDYYNL